MGTPIQPALLKRLTENEVEASRLGKERLQRVEKVFRDVLSAVPAHRAADARALEATLQQLQHEASRALEVSQGLLRRLTGAEDGPPTAALYEEVEAMQAQQSRWEERMQRFLASVRELQEPVTPVPARRAAEADTSHSLADALGIADQVHTQTHDRGVLLGVGTGRRRRRIADLRVAVLAPSLVCSR